MAPKKHSNKIYIDLTLKLHDLIAEDKCDSEEADEVRDLLEDMYRHLDQNIKVYTDNLSGDLYMLTDRDMFIRTTAEEKIQKRSELSIAVKDKRWKDVLVILRYGLGIERSTIAFLRSRAYMDVSIEASRRFMDKGLELSFEECIKKPLILQDGSAEAFIDHLPQVDGSSNIS